MYIIIKVDIRENNDNVTYKTGNMHICEKETRTIQVYKHNIITNQPLRRMYKPSIDYGAKLYQLLSK